MKFNETPFYLLLFAIYPVTAMMGFNIDRTTLDNLYRPLIFSIGIVFIIFIFSFLITRKSYLAAGVTLILLLPFFSYGHVF